ncbi:hypothetical protein K501DRAFT_314422 [Backusella circina FSU 941]|nr:hypothetical protein K501DRAFT_314422 [Backusella circina FSU 941]
MSLCKLPLDLQQIICEYAIGENGKDRFVCKALLVNKTWAYFVCRVLYRHYRVKSYIGFLGFIKTVIGQDTFFRYGDFIRSIDLSPVNKYGVDPKAHRLMARCPYIESVCLGHPTTLKTETIKKIAKYNTSLRSLSMGGIESFPFMLECDFSGLLQLEHVTLTTTPLLPASFMTLTNNITSLTLVHVETLTSDTLLAFCQSHSRLRSLVIENCRALAPDLGRVLCQLIINRQDNPYYCHKLKNIELTGHCIDNEIVKTLFFEVPKGTRLDRLTLSNTLFTSIDLLKRANLKVTHFSEKKKKIT